MSTEGGEVDGPESRVALAERLRGVRASIARIGGLALAVIIIAAIFSIRTDGQMLDTDNLLGIARAVSTVAILSLGLLVVIIAGEIDLSFANLYGLCTNVMAVVWLTHEWPVYVAIVIAFAVATALSAISFLPGGAGSFEAAMVVVLARRDIPFDAALAATVEALGGLETVDEVVSWMRVEGT